MSADGRGAFPRAGFPAFSRRAARDGGAVTPTRWGPCSDLDAMLVDDGSDVRDPDREPDHEPQGD